MSIETYGLSFPEGTDQLEVEMAMIRFGGKHHGFGVGLFEHYRRAQTILWPDDDHHRWSDNILRAIVEHEITVLLAASDSAKTYGMSKWALVDWWAFPNESLFLVSSTEYRGSELRIWGALKTLFNRARSRFEHLPGRVLESMHAITFEEVDDDRRFARTLTKGFIFVPCLDSSGSYVGLGKFVGIKSPRLRHIGDEVQAMGGSFLEAYANWCGKEAFKGVMAGNPNDPADPLGVASEPKEGGWDKFVDTGKTQEWESRFMQAHVLNLDGRDSPNFDTPAKPDGRDAYHYLIGRKKFKLVTETYGMDSMAYWSQCVGKMKPGLVEKRIITRQMCLSNHATEQPLWASDERIALYAIDPAYGGGDRCVGRRLEFGESAAGGEIVMVHPPELIPVSPAKELEPEDQIAQWTKGRLDSLGIPASKCFYDSFGKGTLGFAFAKVFGNSCPVPVDSGGPCTARPVRYDLFIEEFDQWAQSKRRLKRCDEHYSKFVTEMWFSVREIVIGGQMRGLDDATMREGCWRMFEMVKGNKYEAEKKEDTKARMGLSPDLFDALAIACEGARRLGFRISRIGATVVSDAEPPDEFAEAQAEYDAVIEDKLLTQDEYAFTPSII